MKVDLEREEILVIIILLEQKRKLFGWEKSTLDKLLLAMGLDAKDHWVKVALEQGKKRFGSECKHEVVKY